jgi:hypothetical protein
VEERRLLLLAALLLPLRKLSYKVKNKQAAASSYIIRESIKWRTKDVDGTALLHAQVEQLAAVHRELAGPGVTGVVGSAHLVSQCFMMSHQCFMMSHQCTGHLAAACRHAAEQHYDSAGLEDWLKFAKQQP